MKTMFMIIMIACAMQWLVISNSAAADPDDLFHRGSQVYTEDQMEEARELVEKGLKQYPDDYKLQRLHELLQQQQQQEQNQQNQDKQEQDKQEQDKQEQQDPSQDQQDQQSSDSSEEQESPEPSQTEETPPADEEDTSTPQALPEEMTEEEALMMLEALKQEEEADRMEYRKKQGPQIPVDKDW